MQKIPSPLPGRVQRQFVRRRGLDTRIFWVYSPDIGVEGKRPKESPQRGTRIGESVLRMSSEPTVPEPVGGNARPFDRVMGQWSEITGWNRVFKAPLCRKVGIGVLFILLKKR